MRKKIFWGAMTSAIVSGSLFTATPAIALTPLVEVGAYFGGEKLAHATFTDGSTDSIDAGSLLDLSAGLLFPITGKLEGQFTIGYRFDTIQAKNGSVDWSRIPVEFKIFYNGEKFRFGGGFTEHLNPELSGTGVAAGSAKFDDAQGAVIEIDYLATDRAYLGIKYTNIDYKKGSVTINGNSTGIVFGYAFR